MYPWPSSRTILAATVALCVLGQPLPAATQREADLITAALREARSDDWVAAAAAARGAGPAAQGVIEWMRLRSGEGNFGAYTAFIASHPDWPGLDLLRQKGEAAIPDGADPARVITYFARTQPQTGTGALALASAFMAKGDRSRAEAAIARAWKDLSLSQAEQSAMISAWPTLVAKNHVARIDNLMWNERLTEAQRMLPLVGADWQALANARIALRRDLDGVNGLIAAVPKSLQKDPGLAWERFAWRMRKSNYDDAAQFLDQQSTSAAKLGRPEIWAERRALLARREMREGDSRLAYRLASNHFLTKGSDYADLEWLAGYIAMQKLRDPARALVHFENMRLAVNSPISLGRAGYWEGRAFEALGKRDDARAAYVFGAKYQTSFYGQLAAERAGLPMDPALATGGAAQDWKGASFTSSSLYQAAELLHRAGEDALAKRFMTRLADTVDAAELGKLADLCLALDEPNMALVVAKEAAGRGVVLPRAYFPVMGLARMDMPVDRELALAIARRESEFDPGVVSSAGARGLMQVMPGTAKMMSQRLGVEFLAAKLTTDWRYNAQMGTAYLAELQEEFGSSIALVAAGYNAGPGRPREWIVKLGDPRSKSVDVVDWIEHVPFTETRNYIMRVAESIPVYRARLAGKPVPIRLSDDLR